MNASQTSASEAPIASLAPIDAAKLLGELARTKNSAYDFTVERLRVPEACARLRAAGYEHLMLITGIDWKTSWEVVYHLVRYGQKETIVLRTKLPRHNPELPSVAHLWPGASWHERETFDLLGIKFTNTPDPRRILLPYDYQGHPLRKDVAHGNVS